MDPYAKRHTIGAPFILRRRRSDVAKAASDYEWLLAIADRAAPKVRDAFRKAVEAVRGSIDDDKLRAALQSGSVDRVMDALGLDDQLRRSLGAQVIPLIEDVFIAAGRATAARPLKGGQLTMRFDISNPSAARFIQQYDFGLIRQIAADTRDGVRAIVLDAFRYGGHPYEQARRIRELVGLTDAQAKAVDNFRTMLEEGDREALTRGLRDRRFDRTLDQALGSQPTKALSSDRIDTMVDRYRARALNARAENIARTETLRASNTAMTMAWDQAAGDNLINRTTARQFWLVTPDDRLCPICSQVPDMNREGVPLGGDFQTPIGPVKRGPLHPQCRCTLTLDNF